MPRTTGGLLCLLAVVWAVACSAVVAVLLGWGCWWAACAAAVGWWPDLLSVEWMGSVPLYLGWRAKLGLASVQGQLGRNDVYFFELVKPQRYQIRHYFS